MKLAPPVTPMVEGEAIVLRITPCRIQPDSDRQIPTSPPTSTRGKRRFQIRRRAVLSSSTKSALATSETENFTLPMPVQIKIESTDSSPNRAMMPSRTVFLFPEGETAVLLIFSAGTPPPPPSPRKALSRRDVRANSFCFSKRSAERCPFSPSGIRSRAAGPAQVDAAPAKIMP